MRAIWALSLFVACTPTEVVEIPAQSGASFISFEQRGVEPPTLEAHAALPPERPYNARPGELELGVLAYDRPLAELGLQAGPIPQAPARLPFRSVPRPASAWSVTSGDPVRLWDRVSPDALATARIGAPGCLQFSSDPVDVPGAYGEIRILTTLDAHRVFVATAVERDHRLIDWRWFLIVDGIIQPIAIRASPNVYAFHPSERGCMWLTQSSTMAACFGPTATATAPWAEQDRIELPPGDAGPIVRIEGIDREGERELFVLMARGRLFRVTDRVEIVDDRLVEADMGQRALRYVGPGHAISVHGVVLTEHILGRQPRDRQAPSEIGELVAISAPTPLGTLVTGDSGIGLGSGISTFDPDTGLFLPLDLPYGGTEYIQGVHFDDVTNAFGTLVIPADSGYLLELVPFERDSDGMTVGWDLCPPFQLARSDFFTAVQQGDTLWLGGNEAIYNGDGRSVLFAVKVRR